MSADDRSELHIVRGFSEHQRQQAANLYDSAFGDKLGIAIPDPESRRALLADCFDPAFAFVAMSGSRLLGMAGFSDQSGALTGGITWSLLSRYLGRPGAVRAAAILSLFERKVQPGQLLMDGIAVTPDARGRGIGTGLLDEIKSYGEQAGFETVRLDVIDTNPGARRLYEREGFVAGETSRFAFLEWLLGFSASTTFEYSLTQSTQTS